MRAKQANPTDRGAGRLDRPHPPRSFAVTVFALLLIVPGALAATLPQAQPQSEPLTEYQIKAAFLYNLAKFVEWPGDPLSDSQAPIVLGIVGEDPFGKALDAVILGKTVNGRGLVVRRLGRGGDLRTCRILFISSSEKRHLAQILESLKGSSVLTVGEADGFVQSGGVIQLLLEESRVRFEINPDAAARARLKISSKLLALARIVADGRRGEKN